MYPEAIVAPMRQECTSMGFSELKSAAEVDQQIKELKGTALVFVNSVCGCAAGMARPGIKLALTHAQAKPIKLFTVFAGNDAEATAAVRRQFVGYPPSSPSMGLMKDGHLVAMIQRSDIEGHSAQEVALQLLEVFNEHCQA